MTWFALVAEFSDGPEAMERRGPVRRKLKFESVFSSGRPPAKVVVLDLSEAGLMMHANDELGVGETFEVMLPEAGPVEAEVVWRRNTLYGCQFLAPVSRAMISAVLLNALPERSTVGQ
jgi:hypothetical protein